MAESKHAVSARLPKELFDYIQKEAKENNRSISSELVYQIKVYKRMQEIVSEEGPFTNSTRPLMEN